MFTNLAIISSILYFYVIYTNSIYLKYVLKPTTTLLIIGVGLQSSKVQNNVKLAGIMHDSKSTDEKKKKSADTL